jgi:hypothetical protein
MDADQHRMRIHAVRFWQYSISCGTSCRSPTIAGACSSTPAVDFPRPHQSARIAKADGIALFAELAEQAGAP